MSVTLLSARRPLLLAKVWNTDGSIEPAADAAWFEARQVSIGSLSDILAVIDAVERVPRMALVKEAIAPGADPKRLRRRCECGTDRRTGEAFPAGLCVVPRDWVMLDVEKLPRPPLIDWRDGDGLAEYARSLLPDAFRNAACVWQLSGSSGHPTKLDEIRLHFFFKLDQAVLPKAWRLAFARFAFIDLGFFDQARLIFTAAPIVRSGCDPLALRHGLLNGDPIVQVPSDVLNRSTEHAKAEAGERRGVIPVASKPMPEAAAAFTGIIARANVLRSLHPAYRGERGRRLGFCKMLRDSFGIVEETALKAAFHEACVGANDPNGDHDGRQALEWARSASLTGRKFSARKLLCDASAALHEAGDRNMAVRAAQLAMVFANIEKRGGAA